MTRMWIGGLAVGPCGWQRAPQTDPPKRPERLVWTMRRVKQGMSKAHDEPNPLREKWTYHRTVTTGIRNRISDALTASADVFIAA